MPSACGSVVVERALAHERLGDRDAGRARELAQRGRGAGADDAVAGERDRVDRAADQVGGLQQLARAGLGLDRPAARQRLRPSTSIAHDVLGQLEVRRAGLLGLGDLERLAHDLGDDRPGELTRAFHFVIGRIISTRSMYWCDSLCIRSRSRLAGERDERRAVEEGVGDRGDEVQSRPGPSVPRQTPARPVRRPYMSAM